MCHFQKLPHHHHSHLYLPPNIHVNTTQYIHGYATYHPIVFYHYLFPIAMLCSSEDFISGLIDPLGAYYHAPLTSLMIQCIEISHYKHFVSSYFDLDWIIILFFIYLCAFKVEKVEELAHKTLFTGGTKFSKLWSKTFRECFEA